MPIMKFRKFVRIFTIISLFVLPFQSCEKDSLDDPRDNLTGSWKCSETGTASGSQTFKATITKASGDSTMLYIDNFYNIGKKIYVKMNSFSLVIPSQTVDNYKISGTGVVSGDFSKIEWSYSVYDGGETDVISATYTPYKEKSQADSSALK
jgi:hypothetical protein